MEKNKKFINTLLLINDKIINIGNITEQLNAINELNNLINDKKIKNIIEEYKNKQIEKNRKKIEENRKIIKLYKTRKDLDDYIKRLNKENNSYEEEIKKIEILIKKKRLNIQEIFNISVENNFVGIFRHIMENYRQKIDINAKVNDFNQPLIFKACEKEKDEIFKSLLSDLNISFNYNIFNMVCKKGKLDYVKLILEEVKKPDKKIDIDINKGGSLYNACCSGNIELVKYLLSLDDIKIDLKDDMGNTIFMLLCNYEHINYKCAELLYNKYIEKKITFDINKEDNNHYTAIYYACSNGNIDLVNYLLSIPDIDNTKNFNFFPAACLSGNIKLVQLLYNRFYDKIINNSIITKSFCLAIESGNINLIKYLMEIIPDIENKIDFDNEEFMFHFMNIFTESNLEMAELLYNKFKEKININSIVYDNYTAIYSACSSGNSKVVDFLLSKKWKENIDINITNQLGKTSFVIACERGYFYIAKMLHDRPDFDREKNRFYSNIEKEDWIEYFENLLF